MDRYNRQLNNKLLPLHLCERFIGPAKVFVDSGLSFSENILRHWNMEKLLHRKKQPRARAHTASLWKNASGSKPSVENLSAFSWLRLCIADY